MKRNLEKFKRLYHDGQENFEKAKKVDKNLDIQGNIIYESNDSG